MDQMRTLNVNRKWHQTVMNLILGKNMCGSCLCLDDDLTNWDVDFVLQFDGAEMECTLKNIMMVTFGSSILDIVSTAKFCQKCIDIILKAYFLIHEIQQNYAHIQKRLTEVSTQMKWTQHLDEAGSLNESKNYELTKTGNNIDNKLQTGLNSAVPERKTIRIVLNDESLKNKLIQDPEMHKYLVNKETLKKPKLPPGITCKKVKRSIDTDTIAPHELLELNWAEDPDYDSAIPNNQVSKNQLHSNEALIMDLMEKAKTVDVSSHNVNHARTFRKVPKSSSYQSDSLSVNLINTSGAANVATDDTELVPQDLLELKWPEEQKCTTKQFIKIPVKKLRFNEGLTVKFIPKHKICQLQESMNDVAPYELLELNWNEDAEKAGLQNNMQVNIEQQKHNIDLTKWLEDQGMSTIKTGKFNNISAHNMNIQQIASIKNNLQTPGFEDAPDPNVGQDDIIEVNDIKPEPIVIEDDNPEFNIDVDIKPIIEEQHGNKVDVRCALCNLIFHDFNSYTNHYKTHNIIESAKCFLCPMQFPVIELLTEHLLSAHLQNISYCNVCFAMLSQDKLAEHMSTYHAKIFELINVSGDNTESTILSLSDFCKKCKQPLKTSSSEPHVCVEARSRCKECKNGCIHEIYLASYREQLRAKLDIYKCPDCDYQYKTRREITQHANKVHLEHKPYFCKQCNLRFLLKTSLSRHNNLYHSRCDTCRKVFKDTDALNKHKCSLSPKHEYKCELCGQAFTETKYQQHKQTALAAADVCIICHQSIPIKCNMSRHMQDLHNLSLKKMSDATIYECIICEVDFKDIADFAKHAWVHTGVHECHVCAKRFSSKVLYDSHYKMHLAARCELEKRFECSVCNLQLIDKYAYAHHLQTHGDYGKCTICSKFVKEEDIKKHIEEHETSEGMFQCPHCSLISIGVSQFEVHVNRFHLQTRPYQCDICKKRFYSKHLMSTHIRQHYGNEKCHLCERKFTRKWNLEMHMKVHENAAASS